jgi:hypothetical protein
MDFLAGAEFRLRVLYRDLDAPSRGASFDDLSEACVRVGGDQREVMAGGGQEKKECARSWLQARSTAPDRPQPTPKTAKVGCF